MCAVHNNLFTSCRAPPSTRRCWPKKHTPSDRQIQNIPPTTTTQNEHAHRVNYINKRYDLLRRVCAISWSCIIIISQAGSQAAAEHDTTIWCKLYNRIEAATTRPGRPTFNTNIRVRREDFKLYVNRTAWSSFFVIHQHFDVSPYKYVMWERERALWGRAGILCRWIIAGSVRLTRSRQTKRATRESDKY